MPKNIVVYSDGTGQDGGARPEQRISNIYKMYRISRDHADTAIGVAFCDPNRLPRGMPYRHPSPPKHIQGPKLERH